MKPSRFVSVLALMAGPRSFGLRADMPHDGPPGRCRRPPTRSGVLIGRVRQLLPVKDELTTTCLDAHSLGGDARGMCVATWGPLRHTRPTGLAGQFPLSQFSRTQANRRAFMSSPSSVSTTTGYGVKVNRRSGATRKHVADFPGLRTAACNLFVGAANTGAISFSILKRRPIQSCGALGFLVLFPAFCLSAPEARRSKVESTVRVSRHDSALSAASAADHPSSTAAPLAPITVGGGLWGQE